MHDLYLLCKSLLHRDANAYQVHGTLSKSLLEVLDLDSQIAQSVLLYCSIKIKTLDYQDLCFYVTIHVFRSQ
jgi:hypothetical protein